MTINDILVFISTDDYAGWKKAGIREKWEALKEAETSGRLREIAEKLDIGSRYGCKVTIGAELNRRADPERAANIAAWLR